MKRIITICLLTISFQATVFAQNCCVKQSAGSDFQALALNEDFKEAHLPPLPFTYSSDKASMIQFETLDGKMGNAFYVPSDEPTQKVLIIFHEWWGLNDYIKREAVEWQSKLGNIDVYAVDLYDGKVATDADVASSLSGGLDPKRADDIIKGLISKIGKDKQIATLGWCFGGGWAFRASVLAGEEATGCVMYYGFPEKDSARIAPLKTDVTYIWASQDKFIKKFMVDEFGDKVKATGHKFDMYTFDADHAFANPSNPKYNSLYATQAENIAFKFLKGKLEL
jgi:carboxymethylenebutenolidase